ncbi:MAG: hypothetical protein Q8M02_01035 [Candidatus Didemnitutus sp.]|nr:hypothetical protein [Candidatus Didemnitutus sp.]
MLKETPASLRAYFGLIAIFAFLPVVGQLSEGGADIGSSIVGVLFGTLYSYVAIRMDHLLAYRPAIIRGVLLLNLVLSGLAAAAGALAGQLWSRLPYLAIAFAITAYLYSSVGRLSKTMVKKEADPNRQRTTHGM